MSKTDVFKSLNRLLLDGDQAEALEPLYTKRQYFTRAKYLRKLRNMIFTDSVDTYCFIHSGAGNITRTTLAEEIIFFQFALQLKGTRIIMLNAIILIQVVIGSRQFRMHTFHAVTWHERFCECFAFGLGSEICCLVVVSDCG